MKERRSGTLGRRSEDKIFEQVIRDSEAISYMKLTLDRMQGEIKTICTAAKSDEGFPRCKVKEEKIRRNERYFLYILAAIIGLAIKKVAGW